MCEYGFTHVPISSALLCVSVLSFLLCVRSERHSHPLAVGGADLDPLGRGLGGGMLMDPRRPPVTNLP